MRRNRLGASYGDDKRSHVEHAQIHTPTHRIGIVYAMPLLGFLAAINLPCVTIPSWQFSSRKVIAATRWGIQWRGSLARFRHNIHPRQELFRVRKADKCFRLERRALAAAWKSVQRRKNRRQVATEMEREPRESKMAAMRRNHLSWEASGSANKRRRTR